MLVIATGEFVKIWREDERGLFKATLPYAWRDGEESGTTSLRKAGNSAETRNMYLPSICLVRSAKTIRSV
jgi:hypothetical protein